MTRSTTGDDRGAAAVFIASSLFLLAGFVALSIDIGAGTDERRQDQTGADSAALGGSLELVIYSGGGNPVQSALQEIYSLVDDNLGRTVPPSAWDACIDSGALTYGFKTNQAMFGLSGFNPSDCVSLSEDRNTLRVRVPNQNVDATFGQVIGFSSVAVSAAAEAGRNTDYGANSGAIPSGVLLNTPPGTELCIKTGSNAEQSCAGPSTGDFGLFRPYFYGPINGDNSTICNNTESFEGMARAIADGIDHSFSVSPVAPSDPSFAPFVNGGWCPGVPGPPLPNQVDSAAGFQDNDITRGLVLGSTWPSGPAYPGRLDRGPYQYSGVPNRARVFEDKFTGVWTEVDNRPLWDFIDDSAIMPLSCVEVRDVNLHPVHGTTAQVYAALALMRQCLFDAANDLSDPVIFGSEIGDSPRLAGAPLYWEDAKLASNACCYTIKAFVPVWIEGIWVGKNGPSLTCNGTMELVITGGPGADYCRYHPGMNGEIDNEPPGGDKVDSASALLIGCDQLPLAICQQIENAGQPRVLIYDLQLTR